MWWMIGVLFVVLVSSFMHKIILANKRTEKVWCAFDVFVLLNTLLIFILSNKRLFENWFEYKDTLLVAMALLLVLIAISNLKKSVENVMEIR